MDQSRDLQPESNMCQGNWQQIPDLDPPAHQLVIGKKEVKTANPNVMVLGTGREGKYIWLLTC